MNTALPECNRDAINVKNVYNIYDIIPQDKLETLYKKVSEILNEDSSSLEGYVSDNYWFLSKYCW